MSRRKSQRMFTREQRRANSATIATSVPLSRDEMARRTIALYCGRNAPQLTSHRAMAEAWLGLRDEVDREAEETELMRALEHNFLRVTGDVLTVETADAYLEDPRDYQDEET